MMTLYVRNVVKDIEATNVFEPMNLSVTIATEGDIRQTHAGSVSKRRTEEPGYHQPVLQGKTQQMSAQHPEILQRRKLPRKIKRMRLPARKSRTRMTNHGNLVPVGQQREVKFVNHPGREATVAKGQKLLQHQRLQERPPWSSSHLIHQRSSQ